MTRSNKASQTPDVPEVAKILEGKCEGDAIDRALRAALASPPEELHEGVDMSAGAIAARIRELCELSSLCLALANLEAQ